jgi:hypothetical protein
VKKMWIQPQGDGRYLVGAGGVRRSVAGTDKPDALRRAKTLLTAGDRAAIAATPRRKDRV